MSRQTIYLLIFIALVGVIAYIWAQQLGPGTTVRESRVLELEAPMERLRQLSTVIIDASVLQDPRFDTLTTPVAPRLPVTTPGRPNPFLAF